MKAELLLCTTLFAAICAPAWAINKCTGADGKVSYQETSCLSDAKESIIKPVTAANSGTDYDERIRRATKECGIGKLPQYPEVGWSEEKFLQCCVMSLGPSAVINRTETAMGVSKQYVFEYYKAYVYVRGGKVAAIQRRH